MQAPSRLVLMASAIILFAPAAIAQIDQNAASTDWTAKIEALPCSVFSPEGWQANNRWREPSRTSPEGSAPFGIPYLEWTTQRWNAIKARARACGDPVIDLKNMGEVRWARGIGMVQEGVQSRIESLRRDRDQEMAANAAVSAELDSLAAMPPKQQIARLQTLSSQTAGRRVHDRVVIQLERAQNLAAEQDDAARRIAEADADAAAQRLAATQQSIEQGRRGADARKVEIGRERAALAEQSRRTEAARQEAEAARQRLAQLQQQQQALAPSQAQLDQQRERDEAELRQLRQQRAALEQQSNAAQQQIQENSAQEIAQDLIAKNSDRLASLRFPANMLDATIMFPNGQGGYGPFVTFRQFMSVLLSHMDATINGITAYGGTRRGFSLKRPGAPTISIVIRQDGNELYLDAGGRGDSVQKIAGGEEMSVATVLAVLYQETLKQGVSASLGRQHTP